MDYPSPTESSTASSQSPRSTRKRDFTATPQGEDEFDDSPQPRKRASRSTASEKAAKKSARMERNRSKSVHLRLSIDVSLIDSILQSPLKHHEIERRIIQSFSKVASRNSNNNSLNPPLLQLPRFHSLLLRLHSASFLFLPSSIQKSPS